MTDPLRPPSFLAFIPYALGLFMLFPFLLVGGLWLFAFPDIGQPFDTAVSTSLFAVSVPLVIWFFLCSLGFIANSMAGSSEFLRPQQWIAANVIGVLPPAALCLGMAGALSLVSLGKPWYLVLAPLALASLIYLAIRLGERARGKDAAAAAVAGARQAARPSAGATSKPPALPRRMAFWTTLVGLFVLLLALLGANDPRVILAGLAIGLVGILACVTLISRSSTPLPLVRRS